MSESSSKKPHWRRFVLGAALAFLAAAALAPLLNANRFRGQIHSALESSLNRRVTIGKVHFNVFTGPGFTVDDVLIEDGPGMGIEPFAHVESLEARVRLTSLWTGHLEFSKLRLVEPSVNFVKPDSGAWNVAPWLARAASNTTSQTSLPDIEISDGRLNFKFGNTKSVFYVSDADLTVYPSSDGDVIIRFEGEYARTDHVAQGLGHLVARGALHTRDRKEEIDLSVQLERTAITELTRLFDIQDIGVRGYIASNLKLDGPLSRINVSGDLRIEDIHRWDLMPNKSAGFTLNYTGFLNLPAQQIDIETHSADPQGSPVNGKFVASDYLSAPKWQASLHLQDLPAGGLLETARHMGAPIPAGAVLDTKLNGEIAYSRADGVEGQLILDKGSFKLPQGVATEFGVAPLSIHNNDVHFGPAEIQFDGEHAGQLQASYALNTRSISLALQTQQLGVTQTRAIVSQWLGTGSMPLLEQCQKGTWKGTLDFERHDDAPGVWTGALALAGTQMDLPGMAAPLHIASVSVELQPDEVALTHLHGSVGVIGVDGDYRYFADPARPDRMRLTLGKTQLENVERLLLPTLSHRQGFLARALRLERAKLPDWLKSRQIDGTLQVKNLLAGDASLGAVQAKLIWSGASVRLSDIELPGGNALIDVDLTGVTPQYKLTGHFTGIEYRNGTLDLDGSLHTSGLGLELGLNAHGEGTFTGTGITLAPETEVDEITGEFHVDPTAPRLVLTKLQVTQGPDILHGQGASQADGRIVLDLISGRKQVRMTGMLLPVHTVAEP
jgi:hypothetical protein